MKKLIVLAITAIIFLTGCYLFPDYDNYVRINFNGNGHEYGTPPHGMNRIIGETATLPGNTGMIQYTYAFRGWGYEDDTAPEDAITSIPVTKKLADDNSGVVTLYAVWEQMPKYDGTYDIGDSIGPGILFTYYNDFYYAADHDGKKEVTWDEARAYAEDLVVDNLEKWKVPDKHLLKLMFENLHKEDTDAGFSDEEYWSSASSGNNAWVIHFGKSGNDYLYSKTHKYHVRPYIEIEEE